MEYRVYLLTSPDGRQYVGYTKKTVRHRINEHFWNGKSPISKALRQYGVENFKVDELLVTDNMETALEKEIELIDQLETVQKGFNRRKGGQIGQVSYWNEELILEEVKHYYVIRDWAYCSQGSYRAALKNSKLYTKCKRIIKSNKELQRKNQLKTRFSVYGINSL